LTGRWLRRLVAPDLPAPSEYAPLLEGLHTSGWYSNFGPLSRRLEARLSEMFGAPDEVCVVCCNATSGLTGALLAAGATGAILIPAFTFPASLGAARAAGMHAIVVDVDRESWALGGAQLDKALTTTDARAVMLVAPFGIGRNWDDELAICRARGAIVAIDNASGLGGPRRCRRASTDVFEVFSMHATKPFAIGEGGAIFAHPVHEVALRSALNFGLRSYDEPCGPGRGINGKMSEFHAAIGLAQAARFEAAVKRRQAFAAVYKERLSRYPQIVCPKDLQSSPWQIFPVLLPSAAAAQRFIGLAAEAGMEIRRYYGPSLSRWPQTQCVGPCPVAEDLAERVCALPVRALDIGDEALQLIDFVIGAIEKSMPRC